MQYPKGQEKVLVLKFSLKSRIGIRCLSDRLADTMNSRAEVIRGAIFFFSSTCFYFVLFVCLFVFLCVFVCLFV